MEITYDTNKNAINIEKHGISLGNARLLEWDLLLVEQDRRHNYDEIRMFGYAPIGTRVYCIVYTAIVNANNNHFYKIKTLYSMS